MLDRIPYEIFSKIIKSSYRHFSHITLIFDADEISLPPIQATHVCRSWRTALLSDPTMWTCISLKFTGRNSGEVKEMLSRSGSAPLDVFIERFGYSLDPAQWVDLVGILPRLFQEMHRFRKLHIRIPTMLARVAFRLLSQPAPMLQKFYLEMLELNGRKWATLQEAYQNLFLGNAPNLKHAHLQLSAGLEELQSSSLFKNMSTLHLDFVSNVSNITVINAGILLGILRSSPCLRILNIVWSYSGPIVICSMPSTNHRIPLPYLQKLTLCRCDANIINFFLGRLDFPFNGVDFDITCDDSYPNISNSTLLLHFLSQQRLSFLSVSPGISAKMSFEFIEKMDLGSPTFGFYSKESSVFRIPYDYYELHVPLDALSNLLRKFKMSDITHMCLKIIPSESAVLRRIFPLLENLQHLRVHHVYWDELDGFSISRLYLEVLVSRLQGSNPQKQFTQAGLESEIADLGPNNEAGQRHVFPCPSLHTLELVLSRSSENFKEIHFQKFVQCCKIREQAGYPFKSITIFCEGPALIEIVKIWLQGNKLECSHVEVRIITW